MIFLSFAILLYVYYTINILLSYWNIVLLLCCTRRSVSFDLFLYVKVLADLHSCLALITIEQLLELFDIASHLMNLLAYALFTWSNL